jgi:hypothetical protein
MSAYRLKAGLLVSLLSVLLAGCGAEMEESRPPPPPPPVAPPPAAQAPPTSPPPSAPPGVAAPSAPPPPPVAVQAQPGDAPPPLLSQAGPPPPAPQQAGQGSPPPGWVYSYPEGQWVYAANRGWIWVPAGAATTDVDGVPYAYLYVPAYGWTWYVSPWGWGPYHYGGWVARPWLPLGWHRGWVMRPGAGFRIGMGFRGGFRR